MLLLALIGLFIVVPIAEIWVIIQIGHWIGLLPTLGLMLLDAILGSMLMRSQGRICARMAIMEKVWDYDFDPGTNLVDVYVRRLRDKIDAGFEPKLIHTIRGAGYVLKGEA